MQPDGAQGCSMTGQYWLEWWLYVSRQTATTQDVALSNGFQRQCLCALRCHPGGCPGITSVQAAQRSKRQSSAVTRLFATVLDGVEHSSEQSRHPCPVLAYDPRVIALIGFLFVLLSCAGPVRAVRGESQAVLGAPSVHAAVACPGTRTTLARRGISIVQMAV